MTQALPTECPPLAPSDPGSAQARVLPVDPPDEALMDRYCAGDAAAFEQLFGRYATRLLRFVAPLVGSAQAPDVVQLSFLKLHENRARYRTGARFSTWIFTIARNTALDVRRRTSVRRECVEDGEGTIARADMSESQPPDSLAVARVQAAVEALPEEQRDVVLLHWFAELTLDDAAKTLGISHQAARARASRAYQSLRQVLGGTA
jgi:RNA polymerase sigma factor (sigma-70 family)